MLRGLCICVLRLVVGDVSKHDVYVGCVCILPNGTKD